MFFFLYEKLGADSTVLNVLRYTTFRAAWGMMTALAVCYFAYPRFITWMRQRRMEQIIRADGPQEHLENKVGTPTMGGAVMILGIAASVLLWARLDQPLVWMALAILLGYGAIGFVDDWKKVMQRSSAGLAGRWKLVWQFALGAAVMGLGYTVGVVEPSLALPFFKGAVLHFGALWEGAPASLGWFYIAFAVFVLVSMSNAVNLTDGLDGLAIGPIMTCAATYALLAYVTGVPSFAAYLQLPYVEGSSELAVVAVTIVGAGLGFLWYNTYPAQVFMGDVGSLSLGGLLGVLAILTKHELLVVLVGGIFVLEAVSVVLQVGSYKLTGKRIFAMAPIHHHYEKRGWSEPKIIVRFWIISILLALVALTTIKLR
ncbi:MAG: phospho-N-acetylmuramoyl-pentapeptide-transferase [Pseudomonadota bacterium]